MVDKQRVVVLNGQRILQQNQINTNKWENLKVDKAGNLTPGVYTLFTALSVNKNDKNEGIIIHTDKNNVYQKTSKGLIKHDIKDFKQAPAVGNNMNIEYNNNQAEVNNIEQGKSNSIKR